MPNFFSFFLSASCNLIVFLLQHVQKHIPNLMSNMLAILVTIISCHLLSWDKNKYETKLPFKIACLYCTYLYWNIYHPLDPILVLYFKFIFSKQIIYLHTNKSITFSYDALLLKDMFTYIISLGFFSSSKDIIPLLHMKKLRLREIYISISFSSQLQLP